MSMGREDASPSSLVQTGLFPTAFCRWGLMGRVLGVSITQRLLESVAPVEGTGGQEHERIRIILACRSRVKADVAVATLRKCFPGRSLLLDIEDLDLCNMRNVEDFCQRMLKQYFPKRKEADDEGDGL